MHACVLIEKPNLASHAQQHQRPPNYYACKCTEVECCNMYKQRRLQSSLSLRHVLRVTCYTHYTEHYVGAVFGADVVPPPLNDHRARPSISIAFKSDVHLKHSHQYRIAVSIVQTNVSERVQ